MKLVSFIMLLISSTCLYGKVLILSFAFNRPDFLEIQYKTLQKFFLDEYELVVFSDAKEPKYEQQIKDVCAQYALQCIPIPQEIHDRPYLPRGPKENFQHPSVRNVNAVQYALDTLGFKHDDIVVLLDSDMFLVKPFSAREFLHGHELGGALMCNGYVTFLWHALAFLDMKTMPNKETLTFNCGMVEGHIADSGGCSYYYLKNNPVNPRFMNHYHSADLFCPNCSSTQLWHKRLQFICTHNNSALESKGFDAAQIDLLHKVNDIEFFHDTSFLHYRCGTNWNRKTAEYHQKKTEALKVYIGTILDIEQQEFKAPPFECVL